MCHLPAMLTLDALSLQAPLPEQLAAQPYDELQVTLVDCPGHASLIRTIIGGAQIIDMMLLVVDVTKGEGAGCRIYMLGMLAAIADAAAASTLMQA